MDEMLRSALEWVEAASAGELCHILAVMLYDWGCADACVIVCLDYTRLVDVKGIAEMDGRRELLKRVLGAGE